MPEPVLKEIKEAKGKVHSIGPKPWWWVALMTPCKPATAYPQSATFPLVDTYCWVMFCKASVNCCGMTSLMLVLADAQWLTKRCCGACRDYDAEKQEWGWARPAPVSQKSGGDASSSPKKARRKVSICSPHLLCHFHQTLSQHRLVIGPIWTCTVSVK